MKNTHRKRIAALISLFIWMPLWPFALLQFLFELGASALSWAFDDRWLARTLGTLAEWVEQKFGVDAETEYQQWKERRRQKEIAEIMTAAGEK